MMQALVGIVRTEEEMQRALDGLAELKVRASRAGIEGGRDYNPGWHTVLDLPNLIKLQVDSFDWFKREGLRELLNEISPIQDFTGSKMELRFGEYSFGEPKYPEAECRDRDATFAA